MKKLLVTGGTIFVSKAVAEYFSERAAYQWYTYNQDKVWKKPYIEFIKDRWEQE